MDRTDSEQQQEHQKGLRSERKTRGDTRDAHLDAGRILARKEAAQARKENSLTPDSDQKPEDG